MAEWVVGKVIRGKNWNIISGINGGGGGGWWHVVEFFAFMGF